MPAAPKMRHSNHGRSPGRRIRLPRRRAASTLQVIVALPVLLLITVAIFQFGFLMIVQQTMTTAATEAARAAAREPLATDANAAALVAANRVLQVHNLQIDPTSLDTTSDTKLILEFGPGTTITTGDPDLTCAAPSSPVLMAQDVRATVCLDLTTAPLLNALSAFGLDFAGDRMEISAQASME